MALPRKPGFLSADDLKGVKIKIGDDPGRVFTHFDPDKHVVDGPARPSEAPSRCHGCPGCKSPDGYECCGRSGCTRDQGRPNPNQDVIDVLDDFNDAMGELASALEAHGGNAMTDEHPTTLADARKRFGAPDPKYGRPAYHDAIPGLVRHRRPDGAVLQPMLDIRGGAIIRVECPSGFIAVISRKGVQRVHDLAMEGEYDGMPQMDAYFEMLDDAKVDIVNGGPYDPNNFQWHEMIKADFEALMEGVDRLVKSIDAEAVIPVLRKLDE